MSSPSPSSSPLPSPSAALSSSLPPSSTPPPASLPPSPASSSAPPPHPSPSTASPPSLPISKASPPPSPSSPISKDLPPPPSSSISKTPPPPPSLSNHNPAPRPPSQTTSSPSRTSSSTVSSVGVAIIAATSVVAVAMVLALLICVTKRKKRKTTYSGAHFSPLHGVPQARKEPYFEPDRSRPQWEQSDVSSGSMHPPPPPPHPFLRSYGLSAPDRVKNPPHADPQFPGGSKSWFSYEELQVATSNFSRSNLLGEGGFGHVYRGALVGGQLVAVKQLKVGGGQGEREFRAEVEIISRVHHRHLVSLVGYCIADSQRLLVYDYVPNGTLEFHLHGKGRPALDWPTRLRIAVGAARGLAYLHEDCHPRIIHRDIKSSNILLDNNFEAQVVILSSSTHHISISSKCFLSDDRVDFILHFLQVSDFGLAKLTSDLDTHVTTRVMGTFGYLAPEYASSGKLTEKSDVYSFGVVLLELVTGRRPIDPRGDEGLVEWARPLLIEALDGGELELLADPKLNGDFHRTEMMRMVEAAAACARHSAHRRPRMGQVVRVLEDDLRLDDKDKGVRPGHSSPLYSPYESADYDSSQYSADMKKFKRVALGAERSGFTSSEDGQSLDL